MKHRPVFFINPAAGLGCAGRHLDRILAQHSELRKRSTRVPLTAPDVLGDRLTRLEDDEIPVAVGGDGTVNLLLRVLRDVGLASRPFAVLPLGTGNTFAHTVDVGSIETAVHAIKAGSPRPVSLIVTQRGDVPLAVVSLSAGFESRFVRIVHATRTWRRYLITAGAITASALRARSRIRLDADGESIVADDMVFNAGIYNSPYYGRGRGLLPGADISDARVDVVVHRARTGYWRMLCGGIETGSYPSGSLRRSCATVRLETFGPVQVDGEPAAGGVFECRVEQRAAWVLTPPTGTDSSG